MHIIDCLDWEYLCDQCYAVHAAYEEASFRSWDGLDYYEFIHAPEGNGLRKLIETWWDALSIEDKKRMVNARLTALQDNVDDLKAMADKEGLDKTI